jgi:hypothetical protein
MKRGGFGKRSGKLPTNRLPGHRAFCESSPIGMNAGPGHFFPDLLPMTTLHDPEAFRGQSPEPAWRSHRTVR